MSNMAAKGKKKSDLPQTLALDAEQQKDFESKVKDIRKKTQHGELKPGVVYVGHIPKGFFEMQMRKFFSQFGNVRRLRIARSKKTGRIKGYAFIEFEYDEVAKIVADTMNNYLMFQKLLKCQYLPPDKVHEDTFKGCDKLFKRPKAHMLSIHRHNNPKSGVQKRAAIQRLSNKTNRKLRKLAEMGIDFQFDGLKKEIKKHQVHVIVEDPDDEEITFKTPPQAVKSSQLKKTKKTPQNSRTGTPKAKTPGKTAKRFDKLSEEKVTNVTEKTETSVKKKRKSEASETEESSKNNTPQLSQKITKSSSKKKRKA